MYGGCVSFTFGRIQASLTLRSLHHVFFAVVDVDAVSRRLATETATVEGVPVITPLSLWRGAGGEADARGRLPVAEVEHEGADTSSLVSGCDATELEVGALGADADFALRIVERVVGAEIEDGAVAGIESQLLVGAHEGDGGALVVHRNLVVAQVIGEGDAEEQDICEVETEIVFPLDEVGLTRLDVRGIGEGEHQRARGAVERSIGHLLQRGSCEGRAADVLHIEGQADRVPVAVHVERPVSEAHITSLPL